MADCGCHKASINRAYVLVGSGTQEDGEYTTEIEARAAKIRAGGLGDVHPK
jgi:hypothetical protein